MHRKRYSAFLAGGEFSRVRESGSAPKGRVGRGLGCERGMMGTWEISLNG